MMDKTYDAQIWKGHAMDAMGTHILHIKLKYQ